MAWLIPANSAEPIKPIGRFIGLEGLHRAIECSCVDATYTKDGVLSIYIDDEGLLKERPQINERASLMAGSPLFGNAVLYDFEETRVDQEVCPWCSAYIGELEKGMECGCGWRHRGY